MQTHNAPLRRDAPRRIGETTVFVEVSCLKGSQIRGKKGIGFHLDFCWATNETGLPAQWKEEQGSWIA